MATDFEFILNAIIKVAKTDRVEGLERSKTVTISGTKKGFLKNEKIQISIEKSQTDPDVAAFVTADVNGKRHSEDVLKEILFDLLEKTEMLDAKLKMKLDIIFNDRKMRFEGGRLIVE